MAGQDVFLRFERTSNPVKRAPQHPVPVIHSSSSTVSSAAHTSSARRPGNVFPNIPETTSSTAVHTSSLRPAGNVIFGLPGTSSTPMHPTMTSFSPMLEEPTMTPAPETSSTASSTASISNSASNSNTQGGPVTLSPLSLGLIIGTSIFLILFLGAWLIRRIYIIRRRRARELRKKASVLWGAGEKFNGNDMDPEAGRSASSSWRGSNRSFPPPKVVERDPFRAGPLPTAPRPALFLNPGRRSDTTPVRFGAAF